MNKISIVKLGDLIEFQRGYDLPKSQFIEGNYPVQSSNGVLGYHNEFKVKGPGITIGRSGTVGLPHLVKSNFFPHNTALFIKDFKGNDIEYIFYLLKNLKLGDKKSGSGVPTMNRNHLHPIKIRAYKDLPTQKSIAKVLSDLDAKIELNNKINRELESMAKTLYDYWFVQFDFPDKNGKPYKSSGGKMVYNAELKREIPEGWVVKKLGEIVSNIGTGLNPRDNFVLGEGRNYYVTIKNIQQGRVILDNRCDNISDESLEIINRRSDLNVGDILFTSIEPVGTTYLILEKPNNWNINESVFTIRPNYKLVTSEFLYMFLSGNYIKSYTKNVSAGSIHKGVRHSVLKDCKSVLPYRICVDEFTVRIKPIINKLDLVQKENQQLSELRDWLLPMLMNGQVAVKED